MKGRHRRPRCRPSDDSIDKLELDKIVAQNTSGGWLENVLREEAAHLRDIDLRDIALSVTDPAVYTVARVFELHGLVDGVFDTDDNDALYRVITEIAARRIRERLIGSLGDGRRDPGAGKEIAVPVVLRETRSMKRRMGASPSHLRLVFSADAPDDNTASMSLLNDFPAGESDLDPDEDGLDRDPDHDPYPYIEHTGMGLRERLRAILEPGDEAS